MKKDPDFSWQIRRRDCIAQGALTNSKRQECFVKGIYPTDLRKGNGPFVWDTQGNRYIDFICALGSSILGYANFDVIQAAYRGLCLGSTLSLSTPYEVELAEKIKEIMPFIDKMKFLKTGSDACSAAIRIARAYTGKVVVLSEGYHGWHDAFISLSTPALGIPKQLGMHKLLSLEDIDTGTAAVIVEPIITDISPKRIQWLRDLREKCTKNNCLLIFDEIITGFRFPKYCVAQYYGIEPDLICMGKGMANGLPISVVGGKKHIMDCGEYFISTTFAGELPSIFAALATISELEKTNKYDMTHLWERGKYFADRFNEFLPNQIGISGYPTRGVFEGDPLIKALFFQEAALANVLFGPSFFFNFSHLTQIETVLNIIQDIMVRIKTGSVELKGDMPTTPFAQKMRE